MEMTRIRSSRRRERGLDLSSLADVWAHPRVSSLRLIINRRLRSTLARWVPPGDVIQVSRAAIERGPTEFREIVCHEAAHVVVWDRHGRVALPHGPEWAELMRTAGLEPRSHALRSRQR